jgi:hypothetical protein
MGGKFRDRIQSFLENPFNNKFALWLIGIFSLLYCVPLAVYGFLKAGIGVAILYGLGGWLGGAIHGVVQVALIWVMLQLVCSFPHTDR